MNPRLNKERKSMPISVVGKVKIGMKNEKGYPMSLDYFIAQSNHKHYIDLFNEAVGDKPSRLNIIFVSDGVSEVCNESLELRDKSGALFCKSDGINYRVVVGQEWQDFNIDEMILKYGTKELFEEALIKKAGSKGFKRRLTLRFVITNIRTLLGQWEFTTYADKSSIDQIIGTFDSVMNAAGTVKMIPFDLIVSKVKKDMSGNPSKYPVISLVANNSIDSLNKLAALGAGTFGQGILTEDKILELESGNNQ